MANHKRATNMKEKMAEKASAMIECRVATGASRNIVDDYQNLFATIWESLTPTLGAVTLAAIVDRAVRRTAVEHGMIGLLSVHQDGIDFDQLKRIAGEKDQVALKEGFKLLVANVLDILTKLTDSVLVNDLMKLV